eukprot:325339_1
MSLEIIRLNYTFNNLRDDAQTTILALFQEEFTTKTILYLLLGRSFTDLSDERQRDLLRLLCHGFPAEGIIFKILYMHHQEHGEHHPILHTMNDKMYDITTNNTNSETDTQEHTPPPPLGLLPADIIGHVASFLYVKDYFNFAIINRKVHISLLDHMSLVSIDLIHFENIPQDLLLGRAAHHLKKIRFNVSDIVRDYMGINFGARIHGFSARLRELESIEFDNYHHYDHSLMGVFMVNLNVLISLHLVKYLDLRNWGYGGNEFNMKSFICMLSYFTQAEVIHVNDVFLTNDPNMKEMMKRILPNVRNIEIGSTVNSNTRHLFSVIIGNNMPIITSLTVTDPAIPPECSDYFGLEELVMTCYNWDKMFTIIEKA